MFCVMYFEYEFASETKKIFKKLQIRIDFYLN